MSGPMFPVQGPPWGLALRLLAVLCLLACPRIGAASGAPTITGYAATNPRGGTIFGAPPGAPLLVQGTNLGTSGTVAFAGIPAPPPAIWSPTETQVTVPAAASYPSKGLVTVTTNGQTASGPEFTITPPLPPMLRPGDLDPSFGVGGKVLTDSGWPAITRFGDGSIQVSAMALQPDGRIVVAGGTLTANGKSVFELERYNGNGSPDTTFRTSATLLTDFGGDYAGAYALALQPDGGIVAAGGSGHANSTGQFALARYSVNGSLDTSFGTGGKVLTDFGGDLGQGGIAAVAVQPDGQIVAAGLFIGDQWEEYIALARYQGR